MRRCPSTCWPNNCLNIWIWLKLVLCRSGWSCWKQQNLRLKLDWMFGLFLWERGWSSHWWGNLGSPFPPLLSNGVQKWMNVGKIPRLALVFILHRCAPNTGKWFHWSSIWNWGEVWGVIIRWAVWEWSCCALNVFFAKKSKMRFNPKYSTSSRCCRCKANNFVDN